MAGIAVIISMQIVAHIIVSRIQKSLLGYIPAQHDEQHWTRITKQNGRQ